MDNPDSWQVALAHMIKAIHLNALRKGWWEDHSRLRDSNPGEADRLYQVSRIMLVVTELAEAVEGIRLGNPPDDKVKDYDSLTVELADAVIRVLDLAGRFGLPLPQAILAKMAYNEGRSHMHGGKLL